MKSSRPRRRLAPAVLTLITAIVAGLVSAIALALPAGAAGGSYVALGDSYSSGTGTRTYISDGTSCYRSVYAYPSLDAAQLGLSLTFRACSGAKVADVTNTQLSALTTSTAYVTISVGGNDAGFADVLTDVRPAGLDEQLQRRHRRCAVRHQQRPARPPVDAVLLHQVQGPERQGHRRRLPPHLQRRGLQRRHVVLADRGVAPQRTADLLNAKTAARPRPRASPSPTRRRGSSATPCATTSSGSTACPTRSSRATTRTGAGTPTATCRRHEAALRRHRCGGRHAAKLSASTLEKDARRYTAADRKIKPKEFVAPDLGSARARTAAAAAGVDLSSRASIDPPTGSGRSARRRTEWARAVK